MKQILAYGPSVQSEIVSFITAKRSTISPGIAWGPDFLDRLLPFATAGKLLRGCTVCFSYSMFSGEPPSPAVLNTAVALELAHSALLIHDDVMDHDDTRRGQPALHQQYKVLAKQRQLPEADDFGRNMAICGGDAALMLAFALLSENQTDPQAALMVNRLFARQLAAVCAGQMQDIYFEASPTMPAKQAIYALMRTKTAAYTLELPLALGAVLAGQSAATIQTLEALGAAAGTIFQIRDDELSTMGNASKLGKPVGSDIQEGKKTLLYYYLMKRCSPIDRAWLKSTLGNPDATPQAIQQVQNLTLQYEIPTLLNQEITRLQHQAMKYIDQLKIAKTAKVELSSLVRFCATRQT